MKRSDDREWYNVLFEEVAKHCGVEILLRSESAEKTEEGKEKLCRILNAGILAQQMGIKGIDK